MLPEFFVKQVDQILNIRVNDTIIMYVLVHMLKTLLTFLVDLVKCLLTFKIGRGTFVRFYLLIEKYIF